MEILGELGDVMLENVTDGESQETYRECLIVALRNFPTIWNWDRDNRKIVFAFLAWSYAGMGFESFSQFDKTYRSFDAFMQNLLEANNSHVTEMRVDVFEDADDLL